jgi:GT2 family glycosyltransferase
MATRVDVADPPVMNKPERPSVAALILTYNDATIVLSCIRSVQQSDYPNLSVFVIDNGSQTDVVGDIRRAIPNVNVIALPQNLGYAGGLNSAMKQLYRDRDGDIDYFWILNNDLDVAPDTLSRLIDVIEADSAIGFVGPETFRRGGDGEHDQWITRRHHPDNPGDIVLDSESNVQGATRVEVEFVVGHCLLIRTRTIETLGMMREFFIYWEEREWQWRAKEQGWRCYAVPGSYAYHDRHSFGKPFNTYLRTRNCIFFNRLVLASDPGFMRHFLGNLYKEIKGAVALSLRKEWSLRHTANFVKGFAHGVVRPVPDIDYL